MIIVNSYAVAFAEELGGIKCGGIPMAVGVQTDMATPALARFGSDYVKEQFLRPSSKSTPSSDIFSKHSSRLYIVYIYMSVLRIV